IFGLSVDDAEGRAPEELGHVRDIVDAEVSPDGRRSAFVTSDGVYLIERGLRQVSREKNVSTLWFSRDGARLLFASPRQVTLLEGDRTQVLDAHAEPWKSARFVDGGRQVLVAAERSVLRWNPATGERQTLAVSRDGATLLAADLLGDEIVVWEQGLS